MELKLTADKNLLDVLERIAQALNAHAPVAVQIEEPKEEPAALEEPAQSEPEPAAEAPAQYNKSEVQSMAIKKIQAGNRDAVKALIKKYGAERVGDVADDKLAAFAEELEAL